MYLTRFVHPRTRAATVGVETEAGELFELGCADLPELLELGADRIRELVESPGRPLTEPVAWLPPVAGRTEVWAAGVTYERSREARIEESQVADVYSLVYGARRPELFFKSVAWRVVTDTDAIGIRDDSPLNVPEAEIAIVANAVGETVGYTICNDVSSRSIEGENPLYLPQAKVYAGACALHRRIRLAWTVSDAHALSIRCTVTRNGHATWSDATSTARMHRSFDDLLAWAFLGDRHPQGMVLSTGTGLVPGMDFTLRPGDEVAIEIESLGTLCNTVARGRDLVGPKGSFSGADQTGPQRFGPRARPDTGDEEPRPPSHQRQTTANSIYWA